MAFTRSYGSRISLKLPKTRYKDIDISKVAPLDILDNRKTQVERTIDTLLVDTILILVLISRSHEHRLVFFDQEVADINTELDLALLDHVDLIRMVPLVVQDIIFEQLKRLQFRHYREKELVLLVLKEVNTLHDLSMSALYNLTSKLLWQIVQKLLLLSEAIG